MRSFPKHLREIQTGAAGGERHEYGHSTREWMTDWTATRVLWDFDLVAVGITNARPGFRFVVAAAALDAVILPVGGSAVALTADGPQPLTPGHAYVMPAGVPHAYAHAGRATTRFVWVCYRVDDIRPRAFAGTRATRVQCDPMPLERAVVGLRDELTGPTDDRRAQALLHWTALVDLAARRIASPAVGARAGESLAPLWKAVHRDLGRRWTLDELADEAGLSPEVLRLRCLKEVGRPPMSHLTHLRMQQARAVLARRDVKVAAVARAFGYDNAFAFSTAFRRHTGIAPVALRRDRPARPGRRPAV